MTLNKWRHSFTGEFYKVKKFTNIYIPAGAPNISQVFTIPH